MKNLKFCLILCLCFVVFGLTGCGKGGSAEENGPLRVAFINGNDQYLTYKDGKVSGIEANLANRLAQKTQRDLDVTVADNLNAVLAGLKAGDLDVAFGRISDTEPALSEFKVSRYYGKGGFYFLAKRFDYTDNLNVLTLGNIGYTSTVSPYLEQFPGSANVVGNVYEDKEAMVRDIISGTISLSICSEREAFSLLNDSLQVQEALNGPKESYVAVMPSDSKLVNVADTAINEYYEEILRGETSPEGTEEIPEGTTGGETAETAVETTETTETTK
ncbi:MAG: transporter substrate-binding domain-containing protein [Lachnospiraceae bacterium]|nr:transporter substrate-binding domain-containing protein [Lachnospiraceae bacterium]